MNPMVRKELRQRMRERKAWLVPLLYLTVLGAVVAVAYFFSLGEAFNLGLREVQGAEIGVAIFLGVAYAQLTLLLLLVPVFTAATVTIEKEQRTLASLLTSLLTTGQIWRGKFFSSLLFLVLLLVSALPLLSLVFAFGGVGPLDVLLSTFATFVVIASLGAVGLCCSVYFRRSVHATAVTYSFIIALCVVSGVVTLILTSHWESAHRGMNVSKPEYLLYPLYVNPYYLLTTTFIPSEKPYPEWLLPLAFFVAIGLLAAALALRLLPRTGEQV